MQKLLSILAISLFAVNALAQGPAVRTNTAQRIWDVKTFTVPPEILEDADAPNEVPRFSQISGGGLNQAAVSNLVANGTLNFAGNGIGLTNLHGYWATSMLVSNDVSDLNVMISSVTAPQNSKLQWLLDRATNAPLFLFWDTKNIAAGLRIHPNTIIQVHEGCGGVLMSNANVPLLANANIVSNQMLDYNIVIDGGIWNGSHTNQQHDTATNGWNGILRFFGVRNLRLQNMALLNSRTFAAHFINVSNVICDNVYVNFGVNPGTPFNSDGLHFNGPASNIRLRNIRGLCNDDLIALNANEPSFLPDPGAGISYTNLSFYMGNGGDITDVDVDGVTFQNQWSGGIRLLSSSNLVDRIRIANVTGIATNKYLFIDNYIQNTNAMRPQGPGYYGAISLENWSVEMTGNGNDAHGTVSSKIKSLDVIGWKRFQFQTDKDGLNNTNFCPSIGFVNAAIDSLHIAGCTTVNTNVAGQDGRVFYLTSGQFGTVNINNNTFRYPNGDGTGDNGNNWPIPIFNNSAFVHVLTGGGNTAQGFTDVVNVASTVTNNFVQNTARGTTGSMRSFMNQPNSAITNSIGSALTVNNVTAKGPFTSVGLTVAQGVYSAGTSASFIAVDRTLGETGSTVWNWVMYANSGRWALFNNGANKFAVDTNGMVYSTTITNSGVASGGVDGLLGHNYVRNSQLSAASNAIVAQITGGSGVLSISQDGSVVVDTPVTNINFVGATVDDDGNGNATVTVTGGGGGNGSWVEITNYAGVLGGLNVSNTIENLTDEQLTLFLNLEWFPSANGDQYEVKTNGVRAALFGLNPGLTSGVVSDAGWATVILEPGDNFELTNHGGALNIAYVGASARVMQGVGGSSARTNTSPTFESLNLTNLWVLRLNPDGGLWVSNKLHSFAYEFGTNVQPALATPSNSVVTKLMLDSRFSTLSFDSLVTKTNWVTNMIVLSTNGFIATGTDGTQWRVRINNAGAITTATPP